MQYNAETGMATFTELDNFEMQMEFVEANDLQRRIEKLVTDTKEVERKRVVDFIWKFLTRCKE